MTNLGREKSSLLHDLSAPDLSAPHIVCHLHTQTCTNCGNVEKYSHIYRSETHGRTRKLLPVRSANEIIGLATITHEMPEHRVPLCGSCIACVAIPDAEATERWRETVRRKNAPALREDERPSVGSTIDDL